MINGDTVHRFVELYAQRYKLREPVLFQHNLPNPPYRKCEPKIEFVARETEMPQMIMSYLLEYAAISDNPLIQAKFRELIMCAKLVIDTEHPEFEKVTKAYQSHLDDVEAVRQRNLDEQEAFKQAKLDHMTKLRDIDRQTLDAIDEITRPAYQHFEERNSTVWEELFFRSVSAFRSNEPGFDSSRYENPYEHFRALSLKEQFEILEFLEEDHYEWIETEKRKLSEFYEATYRATRPIRMSADQFIELFDSTGEVINPEKAMEAYENQRRDRNNQAYTEAEEAAIVELQNRNFLGEDGYDKIYDYHPDRRTPDDLDDDGYF